MKTVTIILLAVMAFLSGYLFNGHINKEAYRRDAEATSKALHEMDKYLIE